MGGRGAKSVRVKPKSAEHVRYRVLQARLAACCSCSQARGLWMSFPNECLLSYPSGESETGQGKSLPSLPLDAGGSDDGF